MRFSRNSTEDKLESMRREAEARDAKRRAQKKGVPVFQGALQVSRESLKIIKEEDARAAGLAVLREDKKTLYIIVYNPQDPRVIKILRGTQVEGFDINLSMATQTQLESAWEYYKTTTGGLVRVDEKKREITDKFVFDKEYIENLEERLKNIKDAKTVLAHSRNESTTDTLLKILGGALVLVVSDIHLEHRANEEVVLRYRIDGVLHDIVSFSQKTTEQIISRTKLLAGLKLNIKDAPQDGRFTVKTPQGDVEIRVSIIPAEFGEALTFRVLDPRAVILEIDSLGIRHDDQEIILRELKRPDGMILATGPTGSGKTTTLYAFLKIKKTPALKIITIEDPIEYHIDGVQQTQVDKDSGYTFSSGLKSILRQDPDILLIGEIRDLETAQIAIHASLTGHLVFSTLHTNDATGAVPRLIDLGVKQNIIGSSLSLVLAQRLVRRVCVACREEVEIGDELRLSIDNFILHLPKRVSRENIGTKLYNPKGCGDCTDGYVGRLVIVEVLEMTSKIKELAHKSVTEKEMQTAAREQGMVLMQEDGIIKALQGVTTLIEVEEQTGPILWK